MNLFVYFFTSYFKRLNRFFRFPFSQENIKRPFCLLEWFMLLLDLLGLPEIIQLVHRALHWRQRKLSAKEYDLAFSVFKDSINWSTLRLNDKSWVCKKYRFAFVGFHTVHYWNKISDDILIHELVHVWQYEKFGSAYIVRALHAQNTEMGYDYGGVFTLAKHEHLLDFNFEQMAEVIRDAYLNSGRLPLYNKYMKQLLD